MREFVDGWEVYRAPGAKPCGVSHDELHDGQGGFAPAGAPNAFRADATALALSRRHACALFVGMAAMLATGGLAGCSSSTISDEHSTMGYSDDTLVKDYPLTVRIIADANLSRRHTGSDESILEEFFLKYQSQSDRGDVTFAVKYIDSANMGLCALNGFEECDGVVGFSSTVDLGVESGYLYYGLGGTSVRKLSVLNEKLVVVRATGSTVEMPAAKTLSGEDSTDGSFTKIDNLASFDGMIAIASDSLIEGVMFNQLLYRHGLYTEQSGIGGEHDAALKGKLQQFDSIDALASAVKSGTCGIGFVAQSSMWSDLKGLDIIYIPDYATASYKGASLVDAAEGAVARDFFEFIVRMA